MNESDTKRVLPPLEPGRTALLVIDVQKDFVNESMKPMVDALKALLAHARAAGVFVVYIQNFVMRNGLSHTPAERIRRHNVGLQMDVTVDGTKGQEFVYGTSLETVLRARGIETVLITGVATHGCVTGTSYASQARDFNVVVVEDCVATWSEELHQSALRVLRGTMAGVIPSALLKDAWDKQRKIANA
jgi:nicotinamidase-related amidase